MMLYDAPLSPFNLHALYMLPLGGSFMSLPIGQKVWPWDGSDQSHGARADGFRLMVEVKGPGWTGSLDL